MSFFRQLAGAQPADHSTLLDHLADPYVLIPLLVVSAVPVYQALIFLLTPKPLPGIPHLPHQAPILGDAISLGKCMSEKKQTTAWFDNVVRQLSAQGDGGICQVVFGFGQPAKLVIVSDAHEAEDILTRRTQEFDRALVTQTMFSVLIPNSQIALPTNLTWKHHRRLLGPAMTSKNLAMFTPRATATIDKMIKLWRLKSERLGDDGYFDCREDFSRATMDTICEIAFGESYRCLDSAIEHVQSLPKEPRYGSDGSVDFTNQAPGIHEATHVLFNAIPNSSAFPRLSFLMTSMTSSFRKASSQVNSFLSRKMKEGRERAIARGQDTKELADCVLDLICSRETGTDKLSDRALRDELFTFLLGGEETGSTTMTWVVIFLAKRPDIQHQLKHELVEQGLGDRLPTFADVQSEKTPLLDAVVHESLRCANTAGAVTRSATQDTTILGKFIPKGTTIYVPLSLIQSSSGHQAHSDEARSESSKATKKITAWDPKTVLEFEPSRWLVDGRFDSKAGPWMPFSLGPRGCYGRALAILQLKLFIAQITLSFFLESIPEEKQPMDHVEFVTRKPKVSYVRPRPW